MTVDLDGHQFASTVAVMGGRYLIAVNAAVRDATGLAAGDTVQIELTLDRSPRTVPVPVELAAAMAARPAAAQAFDGLTPSQRNRISTSINDAKTPETRDGRIAKALTELDPTTG